MRWVVVAVVLLCGVVRGAQPANFFELPFSKKPPVKVQKIIVDAQKALRLESDKIFKATEKKLHETLSEFLINQKHGDANFTKATLDVFKTWLLEQEFYELTPSPVGEWRMWNGPHTVTLYPNHTGAASYHNFDVLWAKDGLGVVRVICARGHRRIQELKFNEKENGDLDSDVLRKSDVPGSRDPADFWTRVR